MLLASACTFGGGGDGSGTLGLGDSADDGAGDGAATDGTDGGGAEGVVDGDSAPGDGDADGDDAPDDGDADGDGIPTGQAVLTLSDGPVFSMDATVDNGEVHLFELSNVGDRRADNIEAMDTLDPAFVFAGGFPGANGTCQAELQPGADCIIELHYRPFTWGFNTGELAVSYDGGDAGEVAIALEGRGGGLTSNQLANPDFEAGIQSWSPSPNSWTTNFDLVRNSNVALAGTSSSGLFSLSQVVDISDRAALVDTGAVGIVMGTAHRAGAFGNNLHSMRIEYRDGSGVPLAAESSGEPWAGDTWATYSDEDVVPANTRSIRVSLDCSKVLLGGSTCDGYFDDVNLQLRFPVGS